jgi:hypothetical protein
MRSLGGLVLLGVLAAVPAGASCDESPRNLLATANCGFDKDATGWTALTAAPAHHDVADGGTLQGVADSQGSLIIVGPCVAAQAKTSYSIGGRLRSAKGKAYFCALNVYQYSDDRCNEGAEPLGSAAAPPSADWAPLVGSATTSAVTKSVQVRPTCSGEPGFVVSFDDLVFGKT